MPRPIKYKQAKQMVKKWFYLIPNLNSVNCIILLRNTIDDPDQVPSLSIIVRWLEEFNSKLDTQYRGKRNYVKFNKFRKNSIA